MEDRKKKPNVPGKKYSLPFFLVLGILTVISFLIPLRPQRSYSEKRELASFPEFSKEALLDGSYFDQITLWFSDTFPGREQWLTLADYDDTLYGYSEIYLQGNRHITETVPDIPEFDEPQEPVKLEQLEEEKTAPETTESVELPETAPSTVTETTPESEQITLTATEPSTIPEPTVEMEWGGVEAGDAAEIIRDVEAFQIDGAAFLYQNFSQTTSNQYAAILNQMAEKVKDKGVTVVSAPALTAVGVMIEDAYQEKLGSVSQKKILNYIRSKLDPQVVSVDTVSALIEHNDEYLFFRTDHHWTALGAYYSYQALCEAIGLEAVDINTLDTWDQGEFKGSLYGKVKQSAKLRPDTVTAYVPKGDIFYEIFYTPGYPTESTILNDASNRTVFEKYLVFGTDYPMTHAENRSLPDAPNCIVVKDSFGNCFVPFLSQSFHHVYAVDYRKYYDVPIVDLVEKYDIDYIIVMPYITAIQDSQGPGLFKRICLPAWG